MQLHLAELFGIAAAAASLYAAQSKTIVPLRTAAIVANCLAMIYSFMHGTYPTFALNAILLPINTWRLHAMMNLIRKIDIATQGDLNAEWLLPYTRPKNFKAGSVLCRLRRG
jgi:CRP/FNR family cyclic AMP-dependent transcriptional regulator